MEKWKIKNHSCKCFSAMVFDSDVGTFVWEVITGFPGDYSPPGYPSP